MNEYLILMKSELMIALIIFILLFIKLGKGLSNTTLLSAIQLLLLLNVALAFTFNQTGRIFDGMYVHNQFIGVQKGILAGGVYLISLLCSDWLRKSEHLAEFFILMLSALMGMNFLVSSDNLLMFYLSLELSTIPVAAMANFDLERKKSSEAAMKMILSSALSSGILLFGISIVYGLTGSLDFSQIWGGIQEHPLHIMAFVFLFSAFAFKMSVIPFHFWTADVYEGSPVAVTAFLSVISKGAVAFILLRVLYTVFPNILSSWYALVMILSMATMLVGNLFAIRQDNLLRFLAFSSIAQVGFILVGVSSNSKEGLLSVTYFLLVYIFSNLAAFGVAAILSTNENINTISGVKGLYQRSPVLAWTLALGLFSLAGIPPAAGFFGKLFLLMAGAAGGNYWYIAFAALNMIISLYYYLKVVRIIFSAPDEPVSTMPVMISGPVRLGLLICSAGIVFGGVFSWIYDYLKNLL
jgi:NADH-quinone oxidoreductase subunit N